MEGLPEIPDLDVPHKITKRDTFTYQLSKDPVPYDERIQEYVYSHPCPSWYHITCQLQDMGFTEAAKKAAKYVKGLFRLSYNICTFTAEQCGNDIYMFSYTCNYISTNVRKPACDFDGFRL